MNDKAFRSWVCIGLKRGSRLNENASALEAINKSVSLNHSDCDDD